MEVRRITLSAGVPIRIDTPGRFFMLTQTGGPLDVELVKAGSIFREKATDVEAGYKTFPDPSVGAGVDQSFDGVRLTSATGQVVQYAITDRAGDYGKIDTSVQIQPSNTVTTVADIAVAAAAVTVLAANANRKHSTIRNVGAATIRIGDAANIAAARGYQLRSGEFYTHDGTEALSAIREGATSSTVCVIEHTRV